MGKAVHLRAVYLVLLVLAFLFVASCLDILYSSLKFADTLSHAGSAVQNGEMSHNQSTEDSELSLFTAVVVHSGTFWWTDTYGANWQVSGCSWQGQPLTCQYVSAAHAKGNSTATLLAAKAVAYVNHLCWGPETVPQQYRSVPMVMYTLESDANYPCVKNQPNNIEMSYRTCAEVWTPYVAAYGISTDALQVPAKDVAEKQNAIIYVNSNCAARSGRHTVMQQLQQLLHDHDSSLAVHSYGACQLNMDASTLQTFRSLPKQEGKKDWFSKYKFCVAMENSLAQDYVTEKVYDALIAGCIPIYWGAPNIVDYIPDENSIIDYAKLGSPEALRVELERLASSETAYQEKLAWKYRSPEQWNPGKCAC